MAHASAAPDDQSGGFINRQFLLLDEAHQKFWIQGAMYALGLMASGKDTKTGKCVIDWYFGDKRAERNGLILASMEKYPKHILALFLLLYLKESAARMLGARMNIFQ